MKVFVLNYLVEYTDYPCEMYCEGVFEHYSAARAEMEVLFNKKQEEWLDNNYVDDVDDIEASDNGNLMKLFNTANCIDFAKWEVKEMEVETWK